MSTKLPHVIGSITSVQAGAALASTLFTRVGAPGTVLLRQGIAAAILLAISRATRDPRPSRHSRHGRHGRRARTSAEWQTIGLLAVTFAVMNVSMYEAIARVPLGIAVTIELLGPLALSAHLVRSRSHLGCVALAVGGVALLSHSRDTGATAATRLDLLGIACALLAAAGWATYILLNRRLGGGNDGDSGANGVEGLGLALAGAALLVAPLGIAMGGTTLLAPAVLATGIAVAVLSAALPFVLELQALRYIPAATFGVLMSLSPAIAGLIGRVFLDERLTATQLAAMGCVIAASCVASRIAPSVAPAPPLAAANAQDRLPVTAIRVVVGE